jgi:hypothetical protein
MKFTDDMRFPHPVLTSETGDFSEGEFAADFTVTENPDSGEVDLDFVISITEASIADLITAGKALVGAFIRCPDTYFSNLCKIGYPEGRVSFAGGTLLNRVSVRPVVWLKKQVDDWTSDTMHPEFSPPVKLQGGEIIAIGDEQEFSVGQAKLAPLESIFALSKSDDVPEGQFQVNLDEDKITVLASGKTFETIAGMRGTSEGKSIAMNAIYLPAVMSVLTELKGGNSDYSEYRWHHPFSQKCLLKNVDLNSPDILTDAQKLLELPIKLMEPLMVSD